MATVRYYLQSADATIYPTHQGTWSSTTGHYGKKMDTAKSGVLASDSPQCGSTNANYDHLIHNFVGPALAADCIVGMSVNFCIGLRESNAACNAYTKVHIWVAQGDSGTAVRGTIVNNWVDTTTEWAVNTAGGTALTPTATHVHALAGDRIHVEVGARTSSADATYTIKNYDGGTDATDLSAGADAYTYTGWINVDVTPEPVMRLNSKFWG